MSSPTKGKEVLMEELMIIWNQGVLMDYRGSIHTMKEAPSWMDHLRGNKDLQETTQGDCKK